MLRAQGTRSNRNFAIIESVFLNFVGSSPRVKSKELTRSIDSVALSTSFFDVPAWVFLASVL
jgi:hypothetical protein